MLKDPSAIVIISVIIIITIGTSYALNWEYHKKWYGMTAKSAQAWTAEFKAVRVNFWSDELKVRARMHVARSRSDARAIDYLPWCINIR